MTFQIEFPDFDPATMPAIPAGWVDQSWHNDMCPSFNARNGTVVFVDFADLAQREFGDMVRRFSVQTDPETSDGNDVLLETDDWSAVLAFVETWSA